jgi:Winged helix DNA-binding domain
MTPREIARYRLLNQQIAFTRSKTPAEVVAALGAMQAQDYLAALWAVGQRLPDATEADVERAIGARTIVRTWPLRGTLHFVAAEDARWMIELLGPRTIAASERRNRQLELDDATFARSRKVLARALEGDRQLTRDAMMQSLEKARISPAGQRGYHILWRLAQEGLLCFGARSGKQPTFALLEEWAPHARSMDRDAALAEVARRYFTSHGPATFQDFVCWTGLRVADAKAGLDSVASELSRATLDDTVYWMANELPALPDKPFAAHLSAAFDEYLLGYRDRGAVLDPRYAQRVVPGSNGMFMPTILVDGRVVGTWKRALKKKSVVITALPFEPLKKSEERAFAAAAGRYGQFLGLAPEIVGGA